MKRNRTSQFSRCPKRHFSCFQTNSPTCNGLLALALLAGGLIFTHGIAAEQVKSKRYFYDPNNEVAGQVHLAGSSTLAPLMMHLAARYEQIHPTVNVAVQPTGSGAAIGALQDGTAEIGMMSRPLKESEQEQLGIESARIIIAYDGLAVFVHKTNPLPSISLRELKDIFSVASQRPITTWDQLLPAEAVDPAAIKLFIPDKQHGTHVMFRSLVLGKQRFRSQAITQTVFSGITQGIGTFPNAIGFGSVGLETERIRTVPIHTEVFGEVLPTPDRIRDGRYPLIRELALIIQSPDNLSPAARDFLTFCFGHDVMTSIRDLGIVTPKPAESVRVYNLLHGSSEAKEAVDSLGQDTLEQDTLEQDTLEQDTPKQDSLE